MANRNKIYYPASQIITGLYTSGNEWSLENGTEYIGFYHKYVDGLVMTGAEYSKFDSIKLIPYVQKSNSPVYDSLKSKKTYTSPEMSYPLPTDEDYRRGKFTRYFIRRRNSISYTDILEIDKIQFDSWKQAQYGIDESLYFAISLDWKLTGPLYDSTDSYGVETTNRRMVSLKDVELPGLKLFLTNYTEHTIYSPIVSKQIKKLYTKYF